MIRMGRFAAAPFQPRDHVGPVRFERDDLHRDAFRFEHPLEIVGRRLFPSRRIARIEPDDRLEVPERFLLDLFPVRRGGGLPQPDSRDSTALNKVSRIGPGWYHARGPVSVGRHQEKGLSCAASVSAETYASATDSGAGCVHPRVRHGAPCTAAGSTGPADLSQPRHGRPGGRQEWWIASASRSPA